MKRDDLDMIALDNNAIISDAGYLPETLYDYRLKQINSHTEKPFYVLIGESQRSKRLIRIGKMRWLQSRYDLNSAKAWAIYWSLYRLRYGFNPKVTDAVIENMETPWWKLFPIHGSDREIAAFLREHEVPRTLTLSQWATVGRAIVNLKCFHAPVFE